MSDCAFCRKIQQGGDEHGTVYPTPIYSVVRFEPLNPVTEGHMLFVPVDHRQRAEEANLMAADVVDALVRYAKRERIESYNIIQSNGAPATQTVPHVHFHLVPRHEGDGLLLPWTGQGKAS